jgi:hypothetical protein
MEYATQKIEKESEQCSLCSAKFEIWLNDSRINEERKEKINKHLLKYCPVCAKANGK